MPGEEIRAGLQKLGLTMTPEHMQKVVEVRLSLTLSPRHSAFSELSSTRLCFVVVLAHDMADPASLYCSKQISREMAMWTSRNLRSCTPSTR